MSNINKQALREVAEKATPGNWRRASSRFNGITVTPFSLCDEEVMLAHAVEKRDAEFIVAANPATMLALLDENLQLQREKDAIEAVALALRDDMRDAREKLEAAERRIAELEAKLETADKLQDSAFRDGLKAGFSYGQTDDQSGFAQCMSAYSTRAGIGVKQQEDSVDSDVGSRNQPGMVVAVHIGAGDFVKVKGQVFEVEETDFDDRDVTLWFVGGNALKCAAGCPVEVVSAPVAAGIKVKES
ncbi:ead/Ea22-like family protein [Salmonella enterica subsp. enterica]|nr:ead/Ea22-like family protein [Salmonella enterica subsp. enterica]